MRLKFRRMAISLGVLGLGTIVLSACAPVVWVRPGTPPAQEAQDAARCRLLAEGMNPGGFYASGKPAFVAAAAVVNILGTAAGQAVDYRNCMTAAGYTALTPQQVAAAAPMPVPAAAPQPVNAPVPLTATSYGASAPVAAAAPAYTGMLNAGSPMFGGLTGPVETPCLSMTCQ